MVGYEGLTTMLYPEGNIGAAPHPGAGQGRDE